MNNKITLATIFLIAAIFLVSISEVSYVDAAEIDGILSTFKIDSTTPNGPILSDGNGFGYSVVNIGDLDGDGIEDIAVAAPFADMIGNSIIKNFGSIHIIFLNSDGTPKNTVKIDETTPNGPDLTYGGGLGRGIANIGDLNGDGVNDIAVGASGGDECAQNTGVLHIMFMNTDGSVDETVKISCSTTNGPTLLGANYFGISVANIGDLNGDGVNDIAVGAVYDGSAPGEGAIHIMFMNTNASIDSTVKITNSTANGPVMAYASQFGWSVANIGDLDGDGVNDLAVGEFGKANGGPLRGAIHIMFMNTDGSVDKTVEINSSTTNGPILSDFDRFGYSVAGIGDLDGDGIEDIAVGATMTDSGIYDNSGAIHIMFMNTDGTPKNITKIDDSTLNGPVLYQSDEFGASVANIGDRNGDGVDDLVVGAYRDDVGGNSRGAVYILTLSESPVVSNSPENILATPGNTLVDLTWDVPIYDGGSPLTDYVIEFGNGTAWTVFDDDIDTITNGTVTGLTNDQEYSFRVSAVTDVGTSVPSDVVVATPFVTLYCGKVLESFDNVIYGTNSSDFIQGTDGKDLIFGYGGNDLIDGLKQSDCIYAGDGNDFIQTGMGRDTVYGGNGDDTIRTSAGTNIVFGEEGNDIIYVADKNGFNTLDGGNGLDVCTVKFENSTASITNCEITD